MGKTYGVFKYEIGELITSYERNLTIIDREYRDTIGTKRGKEYNIHHKWYKYKCNDCGNEDWIIEYVINGNQHVGCNACCTPPKKVVKGVNDISTTAPWMMKYIKNIEDAYTHHKSEKEEIEFVCPDCGRTIKKSIANVSCAKTIACSCGDGWSYPNKFMHSVLEQARVTFIPEKSFDWSEKRIYDDYIEHNGLKIITEQHGQQHYTRHGLNAKSRTLEEEKENDKLKYDLAMANGIDYYFVIDCSKSDKDYIKNNICNTKLLSVLGVSEDSIDWNKCDEFATSNFTKTVCTFMSEHPELKAREIAEVFFVPTSKINNCSIKGRKLGWLTGDRHKYLCVHKLIAGNTKPIYCITNGKYYRDSYAVCDDIYPTTNEARSKRLKKHICHNKPYCGYIFKYISQEEFNNEKRRVPDKCVGDFFNI